MRDPQQEKELAECEQCGAELYEHYEVLIYDNCILCDDECLLEFVKPDAKTHVLTK